MPVCPKRVFVIFAHNVLSYLLKKTVKVYNLLKIKMESTTSVYAKFVENLILALVQTTIALGFVLPTYEDTLTLLRSKLQEACSSVASRRYIQARFILQSYKETAKIIGQIRSTDVTISGQCAAFMKQYNSITQNAMDTLIKKAGLNCVPTHSPWSIDPAIRNMLKLTPQGLAKWCDKLDEPIQPLRNVLAEFDPFFNFAMPDSSYVCTDEGVLVDSHFTTHEEEEDSFPCLYCSLGVWHCDKSNKRFERCCFNQNCVSSYAIPSLACNFEFLELENWHLPLIQHYKFVQFYAYTHSIEEDFPLEDLPLMTNEYEYPDLSVVNLRSMREAQLAIQAASNLLPSDVVE
ncbi:hypothetical protein 4 [Hubei picorna-like virus 70]|uniref:hypothetical protein 4 n=1 Tax=Hubei picorna-like virus 70 TaxID=1923154 RepID=UPI00090A3DC0|nr:hypothetical protein 4 [Hubei picorna-like virus 70]APG77508.1 hypothetical protein 4 [Hubei picorna-like virus 70]